MGSVTEQTLNIVVTKLLWNRPPRRLIEWAIAGEAVEIFSFPVLLDELAHTLGYSKFAARIESFGTSIAALVAQYTALVSRVMPASAPRVVVNDADDDHAIAAAVAARAELIVTGDRKRLLLIGTIRASPSSSRVRWWTGWMQDSRPDPEAVTPRREVLRSAGKDLQITSSTWRCWRYLSKRKCLANRVIYVIRKI